MPKNIIFFLHLRPVNEPTHAFTVYITGNIRVFCRCRPLRKEEISAGYPMVTDFDAAKDGELGVFAGGSTKKIFKFDRVYTPKDDQGIRGSVVYL